MYRVPHYAESRVEVLHSLIDAHPFATLITAVGEKILANHVPVIRRAAAMPGALLVGHVARANPVWRNTQAASSAVLIFQGGDHYISPRWYRSAPKDRAVPTWDYSVVHARGPIEWIEDRGWLMALLEEMARTFERESDPWRPAEMSPDYRESLLGGIVGFQVPVESLQGKFKLNQGSSPEDRAGVVSALEQIGTDAARDIAGAIRDASKA